MANPYGSSRACFKAATRATHKAGFAVPEALRNWVITRGYRLGDDRQSFSRRQAYWLHVVQPLLWAAENRSERDKWVRCAHRGAFFLWLSGQA